MNVTAPLHPPRFALIQLRAASHPYMRRPGREKRIVVLAKVEYHHDIATRVLDSQEIRLWHTNVIEMTREIHRVFLAPHPLHPVP